MTIDEGLQQLAQLEYPRKVDVVDKVMATVSERPYLRPIHKVQPWQRIVSTTIAAAIVALIVNVIVIRNAQYDEVGIGNMISQVHDYNYYGFSVEQQAVNPIEFLYDDYE